MGLSSSLLQFMLYWNAVPSCNICHFVSLKNCIGLCLQDDLSQIMVENVWTRSLVSFASEFCVSFFILFFIFILFFPLVILPVLYMDDFDIGIEEIRSLCSVIHMASVKYYTLLLFQTHSGFHFVFKYNCSCISS